MIHGAFWRQEDILVRQHNGSASLNKPRVSDRYGYIDVYNDLLGS